MTTHKDLIDNLMCKFNGVQIGKATLFNCDCNDLMAHVPEKHFELSCVDPPYGIGEALVAGGTWSVKYQNKGAKWDVTPEKEYFQELERVSKNYIIWGANNYNNHIKPARCAIAWVKPNMAGMHTMADFELALTSFDKNAKVINLSSQANEERIHVCQKPIKLYEWLLTNYAKQGDKILDTHLGSGSHAIACNNLGFEITACELDKDYYEASIKRIQQATAQERLFA